MYIARNKRDDVISAMVLQGVTFSVSQREQSLVGNRMSLSYSVWLEVFQLAGVQTVTILTFGDKMPLNDFLNRIWPHVVRNDAENLIDCSRIIEHEDIILCKPGGQLTEDAQDLNVKVVGYPVCHIAGRGYGGITVNTRPGREFGLIDGVKWYPRLVHTLKAHARFQWVRYPSTRDTLVARKAHYRKLLNSVTQGAALLGGLRVEVTLCIKGDPSTWNRERFLQESDPRSMERTFFTRGVLKHRLTVADYLAQCQACVARAEQMEVYKSGKGAVSFIRQVRAICVLGAFGLTSPRLGNVQNRKYTWTKRGAMLSNKQLAADEIDFDGAMVASGALEDEEEDEPEAEPQPAPATSLNSKECSWREKAKRLEAAAEKLSAADMKAEVDKVMAEGRFHKGPRTARKLVNARGHIVTGGADDRECAIKLIKRHGKRWRSVLEIEEPPALPGFSFVGEPATKAQKLAPSDGSHDQQSGQSGQRGPDDGEHRGEPPRGNGGALVPPAAFGESEEEKRRRLRDKASAEQKKLKDILLPWPKNGAILHYEGRQYTFLVSQLQRCGCSPQCSAQDMRGDGACALYAFLHCCVSAGYFNAIDHTPKTLRDAMTLRMEELCEMGDETFMTAIQVTIWESDTPTGTLSGKSRSACAALLT